MIRKKTDKKVVSPAIHVGGLALVIARARNIWGRILAAEKRFVNRNSKVLYRAVVTGAVAFFAIWTAYRIERLGADSHLRINNIVRIQAEVGVPHNTIVAEKTTDFLLEPVHVANGRALVSASRIGRFQVGQGVMGQNARITHVSNRIDIDSGMFAVRFSNNISGTFMVMRKYTGFFLPLEAELPDGARVISRDARRQVVSGLVDGQKIIIR